MRLKQYVLSNENIFLAIYSLKTYIFNTELLSEEDKKLLDKCYDIYNESNMAIITKKVRKIITRLLNEKDFFIEAQVYFKPKKIKDGEKVFRPLHSTDVYTQIAIVSLLNILIYEVPTEQSDYKLYLSNYSRLIPNNFYGNRVSQHPEELFERWNVQYKEYSQKANEYFKMYHSTNEYLYEVKLDLENFFPSINPIIVYNYLLDKIPVTYMDEDVITFQTIIYKLLFCKITNLKTAKERNTYYNGCDVEGEYTQGIPQGLPQAYFFGNICMIEVKKAFDEIFPGKSLYYVDDSVIYTNKVDENSFIQQLEKVNQIIKDNLKPYLEYDRFGDFLRIYNTEVTDFVNNSIYDIRVHSNDSKSIYTKISEADNGEVELKCLSREVSLVGFDFYSLYSEEEDNILNKRIAILLLAIRKEKEKKKKEKKEKDLQGEESSKLEKYLDKLTRYEKYFKFRKLKLDLRKSTSIEEIINSLQEGIEADNIYTYLRKEIDIEEFFERYTEDIWSIIISFLIKYEKDIKKLDILRKYLIELDIKLYDGLFEKSSYIKKVYNTFLEKKVSYVCAYDRYMTLSKVVEKKMQIFKQSHIDVVNNFIKNNIEPCLNGNIMWLEGILQESFLKRVKIVDKNTDEMKRHFLNAIYSNIFNIELSDNMILAKYTKKPILYGELRILTYLRNKKFSYDKFRFFQIDVLSDENQLKIDYSIFEVIDSFKTFVVEPEHIDNLISIHQYTCDVWKNGSKYLYFYTLHNQEHAIDLIKNVIKLVKSISYIVISQYDYYIVFLACYLHDISMVKIPEDSEFLLDENLAGDIAENVRDEILEDVSKLKDINFTKQLLLKFYKNIDAFFEKKVRSEHAKDSAVEIRNRSDLSFLEGCLREAIAEVSESHGHRVEDIYNVKSMAKNKIISYKFNKILLRMADLLDMSQYRVSRPILNHNLEQMSSESAFHWVSHLLTKNYKLNASYNFASTEENIFSSKNIQEVIELEIYVNMSQLSRVISVEKCKNISLEEDSLSLDGFVMQCGKECSGKKCNFLCKWFIEKNNYLVQELDALQSYLNRTPDNFYSSKIIIKIICTDKTNLNAQQFEILKNKLL